jgi:hypothetical protein
MQVHTKTLLIKKMVIYLNGPESAAIKTKLTEKIPSSLPYDVTYKNGIRYQGTMKIEIIAENI